MIIIYSIRYLSRSVFTCNGSKIKFNRKLKLLIVESMYPKNNNKQKIIKIWYDLFYFFQTEINEIF